MPINVGGNSAAELFSIVERVERVAEEIDGLRDDIKEIMAEAKSAGFEPAIIRKAIAARADYAAFKEKSKKLDTYLLALEEVEAKQRKASIKAGS